MIVIVDYGMGNLRSVQKAFERNGAFAVVSSDPKTIERADKVVLPGVGAFKQAMEELRRRRLVDSIKNKIAGGSPYLGICLGMQLLFSESDEEGHTAGFGIIPGQVIRFRGKVKIPHMGWNQVRFKSSRCPVFKSVQSGDFFYFVHSYYGKPRDNSWIAATTEYGGSFCSAVWKGNVLATQFHPEKSQSTGLQLIKNFIKW